MSAKISVDDLAKLYVLVDRMPDRYLDMLIQRAQGRKAVLTARRLAKQEAKMNAEDTA